MSGLSRDARYGLSALARHPAFAVVAVVTLALGIGATTSIFTVVDAVILRPLPYPEPERLVRVFGTDTRQNDDRDNIAAANFLDWKAQSASFEAMAGFAPSDLAFMEGDYPVQVRGVSVTPEFFSVLGAEAALGRALSAQIDTPGAEPAVVISDAVWRGRLGGASDVLGRRLELNNRPFTVVGVMPPGFSYPPDAELWTAARYAVPDPPIDLGEDPTQNRSGEYFDAIGRLRHGVSLRAAQAEMRTIGERLEREYPAVNKGESIVLVPLRESMVSDVRPVLLVLMSAVGFVLLVACSNVAHLLLARATQREREIAVRLALGARPAQILRLLLAESLLLAAAGGALGLAVASWGVDALLALAPEAVPRAAEVSIDLRVLGFTAVLVLGMGLVFGLAPALQLFGRDLRSSLAGGHAAQLAGGRGRRLRSGLVVAEVATSLLLLVGTGLMVRTLLALLRVDAGFDPSQTLVAHVTLPEQRYREDHQLRAFHERVLEQLRALPGVESAGTVLTLPLDWNIRGNLAFQIEGRPAPEGEWPTAGIQIVSEDYFQTLGIPMRRGRSFAETDDEQALPVVLVNETFATTHWPGEDPIGRRVSWGDPNDPEDGADWLTIVGVVGDTHVEGLDVAPRPEVFQPFRQNPFRYMTLVVKGQRDVGTLAPAMRGAVAAVDPQQPLHDLATMEEVLASSLAPRRFNMLLLGLFAGAALLMAAVGLFGVLSFSVAQRSHEIGIRRALGAESRDVILQVLREGGVLVAWGLALGGLAALALTRSMSSLIHGVTAADPPSFAMAVLVLAVVALVAAYLPARRASRVDPMAALRYE